MTPNFALSLSVDGIRLLHRVPGGWHLAGEVALDSSDLSSDLADLHRTAKALDASGIRCKILIPNDQIRYMSLDTTRATEDDIRAALEGATPYAVSELAYDFSRGGGRTYIAAVAQETLDEAEAFAAEHAFTPVSFAAVPEPFTFVGEPFFGAAKGAAKGAHIDRDTQPVEVIGVAEVPLPPKIETAPAEPEPKTVAVEPTPKPDLTPPEPEAATPAPEAEAKPPETPAEEPAPDVPAVTFASRARPTSSPTASRTDTPPAAPAIKIEGDQPVFASRSKPVLTIPHPQDTAASKTAAPLPNILPAGTAPKVAPPTRDSAATSAPANLPPILPAKAAPSATPVAPAASNPVIKSSVPSRSATPAPNAAGNEPEAKPTAKPATFGSPKPARRAGVGGKPRFLGLILTLVLLAFLAAVAVWASMLPTSISSLLGFGNDTQLVQAPDPATAPAGLSASGNVVANVPAVDDEALADLAEPEQPPEATAFAPDTGLGLENVTDEAIAALNAALEPPTEVAPEAVAEVAPPPDLTPPPAVTVAPVGQILSPAEAQRIYAATGVWQRAPRLPFTPRVESSDDVFIAAIDPVSSANDAIALPSLALSSPDPVLTAQVSPPPPGTVYDRDERGFILATAEGTVLPDGLIVYAGRPAVTPPARPDFAPTTSSPDATDQPTAEAAAPQGPLVTPGGVALAGLRPRPRPQGFTDQVERDTLGGRTVSELAALRPRARPEGLAPALPDATTSAIEAAVAGVANFADASELAVAASVRPDSRPRNFDRVVSAARARTATTSAPAASSTVQASSVPSGPIPGGVARAATEESVLSLRQINLIGVYGASNSRSALVRLANGRIVKVAVGDSLDGGQVSAISETAINYVKRGRTYALQMP